MITGQLRSKIDKLWEEFWTGGITNPLTVIEQISFLMFARLLDMRESTEEKKWSRKNPGKQFPGLYFPRDKQHLRWSQLKQEADGERILKIVRDEVFPHFRHLGQQEELASGDNVVFAGSGITDGLLFHGVKFEKDCTRTSSLIISTLDNTARFTNTVHIKDGAKSIALR